MSNLEKMIEAANQNDTMRAAQQATGAAFRADPMMALGVVIVAFVVLVAVATLKSHWSR